MDKKEPIVFNCEDSLWQMIKSGEKQFEKKINCCRSSTVLKEGRTMKIEEIAKDELAPPVMVEGVLFVFPAGIRFDCQQCGACCRVNHAALTQGEIKRLTSRLRQSEFCEIGTIAHPLYGISYSGCRLAYAEDRCVFLADKNRCQIYDRRPLMCRTYPFAITISKDGNICVGMAGQVVEGRETVCPGFFPGEVTRKELWSLAKDMWAIWDHCRVSIKRIYRSSRDELMEEISTIPGKPNTVKLSDGSYPEWVNSAADQIQSLHRLNYLTKRQGRR